LGKCMATPEKKVKERARKVLNKLGAYYFFPSSAYGGRNGVPDIVGCYKGKFFGIECKAGKNKPTKLQLLELNKLKDAGGLAIVFTDAMELSDLEELLKGRSQKDMTHWALQNIS